MPHASHPRARSRYLRAPLALTFALVFGLGAACGEDGLSFTLGPEAALDIAPTAIVFGDVPRGEVARRIVTVRHIGTSGVVRLDPIRLETTSPDLAIGEVEATTLQPGEETRIQLVYTSGEDAPDEGVLVIGHNLAGDTETRVTVTTPGQRGRLIAQPPALDFGVVQEAAPRTLPLRVFNAGTAPATLTGARADGSEEFTVTLPAAATVGPGESIEVAVTYAPRGRDKDEATLTLLTEREDVTVDVLVKGEEETPVLAVEPGLVQLGWVRPGERASRDVVVRNDGNTDLVVERVELVDNHPDLALTARPANPVTLAPGQAFTFGVIFSPRGLVPMATEPLGRLRFTSSDAARDPFVAPVYGAAGVPALVVVPDDVIDFAYVANGFRAVRSAVVLNQGAEAVELTGVELVDATSDELALDTALAYPYTLNPGESVEIGLSFENRGARDGAETARLFIRSTDPVVPVYPLDVIARRAQRPACEVAFVPELLAMGAARVGTTITRTLSIQNVGSGNCEYRSHVFDACLAERFGIGFRFVCDSRIAFNPFALRGGPAPADILGPGETIDFPVAFTAPPVTAAIGRQSYYARLAATFFDPNSNRLAFATPPGGTNGDINIRAEAANGTIRVEPSEIDFGTVRTDCASYPSSVRIRSTGPMETTVTRVETLGCDGTVRVEGPAVPFVIDGFSTRSLTLSFAPDREPPVDCTLRIENDSQNLPVAEVALSGSGTDLRTQTDRFRQLPAPKVDVLFVVDDSFSMADDQERLKQSLPAMAELARSWGQDYRFAVTTTDTATIRGQFKGLPRFVDASMDPAVFAQNLVVGVVGFWIERGLEAADLALYRRAQRTDIACRNVPNQCPSDDGEGLPLSCLEGFCSGRNWGFLRDDADLVVIMVSDEEDGSVEPVQHYINRLAALKSPARGVGVTFHAIVVTPEKGCLGGFGTPALRYIQAAEALNGHVADLCADNFAAEFEDVAARSFGLKDRFYPTLTPDPDTLTVRVNGTPCESGWAWNAAARAVVFEEGAACFPPFDAEIEVTYDILCPNAR
jgi:hypothetical protein